MAVVAVAVAAAVAVVAAGSSSGHLDFVVASPGISDYDGGSSKASAGARAIGT